MMALYWRGVFLRDTKGTYAEWHNRMRQYRDIVFPY